MSLLQDAVASGASLGFWSPLLDEDAAAFWQKVIKGVAAGERILLVAREDKAVVGSVQLELATRQNSRHRAEVQKLMVHRSERGRGLGRDLLIVLESAARADGRTLLVLDTRQGDPAEQLYLRHGYIQAGVVPGYITEADGTTTSTVIFYRQI